MTKNNANLNGINFEINTSSYNRLLSFDFIKNPLIKNPKLPQHFYLSKDYPNKKIIFVFQSGLKRYLNINFKISIFRNPDEAFIIYNKINKKIKIVIIEKKFQIIDGSTDIKLWASPSLKREYSLIINSTNIEIDYILCLNDWFKHKIINCDIKYKILLQILKENNIKILYGEDNLYFKYLDICIFKNF